MALESTLGRMVDSTRDTGTMASSMERESTGRPMDHQEKVDGSKEREPSGSMKPMMTLLIKR